MLSIFFHPTRDYAIKEKRGTWLLALFNTKYQETRKEMFKSLYCCGWIIKRAIIKKKASLFLEPRWRPCPLNDFPVIIKAFFFFYSLHRFMIFLESLDCLWNQRLAVFNVLSYPLFQKYKSMEVNLHKHMLCLWFNANDITLYVIKTKYLQTFWANTKCAYLRRL